MFLDIQLRHLTGDTFRFLFASYLWYLVSLHGPQMTVQLMQEVVERSRFLEAV